ncbi:hypothetical protein D1872_228280 [compost metagenome]
MHAGAEIPFFHHFDGALQPPNRLRNPRGNVQVDNQNNRDGRQKKAVQKAAQLFSRREKFFGIGDADDFPAGRFYRLNRDQPLFALRFIHIASIGVVQHRLDILIFQPGVNELLLRVIDDVADAVDDINISFFTQADPLAQFIDRSKVDVHYKHAFLIPGVVPVSDQPAHGHHPAIFGLKQVLNMRRRKLQFFRIAECGFEPGLFGQPGIPPHRVCRHAPHELALCRKERDGHQVLPRSQQRFELLLQLRLIRDVGSFAHFVLGDLKNILHPAHVHFQVCVDLFDDLTEVKIGVLFRHLGKSVEQQKTDQNDG